MLPILYKYKSRSFYSQSKITNTYFRYWLKFFWCFWLPNRWLKMIIKITITIQRNTNLLRPFFQYITQLQKCYLLAKIILKSVSKYFIDRITSGMNPSIIHAMVIIYSIFTDRNMILSIIFLIIPMKKFISIIKNTDSNIFFLDVLSNEFIPMKCLTLLTDL